MDHSSSDAFLKELRAPPTPSAPPYSMATITSAAGTPMNTTTQTKPTPSFNSTLVHSKSHHTPVAGPWSTGLCGCCSDVSSCCLTCWCPCITFGRIAEMTDRGSTSCGVSGVLYGMILCLGGWACLYSCFYRSKLRGQYLLEESPCSDCCVHCCCEECALCQEYRELQNRGFDMSIGWHGNMERQKRGAAAATAMAPPVEGMAR